MQISVRTGASLREALPGLAQLRIEVFREFPYLYDGTLDDEEGYLKAFAASQDGIIVSAEDGAHLAGCATGSALSSHPDLAILFRAANYDPGKVFYCAEFVLLPDYRGQRIGHAFFDWREAHAERCGYRYSAFCAVIRPDDHPLRPETYSPLDPFWNNRGYRKVPGLVAQLSWKETGQAQESDHSMQFWIRNLDP